MVMYLVLRTFHKLADVQGWTAFFHLPSCDDVEEDKEPIVEAANGGMQEQEASASKPLDPKSHASYNSISR